MAEITAAAVMALREKTGLPMMECKKALAECGGNTEQAVDWLRKQGIKTQSMRADRETSCGRLAVFADPSKGVGTIIELKCESPPVAGSDDFKALANDIAKTLALGPGAGGSGRGGAREATRGREWPRACLRAATQRAPGAPWPAPPTTTPCPAPAARTMRTRSWRRRWRRHSRCGIGGGVGGGARPLARGPG